MIVIDPERLVSTVDVAVITDVPTETPVTRPVSLTVATLVVAEVHVTPCPITLMYRSVQSSGQATARCIWYTLRILDRNKHDTN